MTISTAPAKGVATPVRRMKVGVAGLGTGAGEPAERPAVARGFQDDVRQAPNGLWVYDDDGQREVPVEGIHDQRMAELDEMYRALTSGRPVRHDGRWGGATLEVVLSIRQSAREHQEIMLAHQCDAY